MALLCKRWVLGCHGLVAGNSVALFAGFRRLLTNLGDTEVYLLIWCLCVFVLSSYLHYLYMSKIIYPIHLAFKVKRGFTHVQHIRLNWALQRKGSPKACEASVTRCNI